MTTRNPRALAVAFALAAGVVASAVPIDAGSAREIRTAVVSDAGTTLHAERELWTTLLAGLLGVIAIARRRMS